MEPTRILGEQSALKGWDDGPGNLVSVTDQAGNTVQYT